MTPKALFREAINAKTNYDIKRIISQIKGKVDWVPVGGTKNNLATIHIGKDPASGLAERITNAMDSVIELEWIKKGKPKNLKTPRKAAEKLFGIKNGRLNSYKNPVRKDIQELAKRIEVCIQESRIHKTPTIQIRDLGTGIEGPKFKDTILSLHGSNKNDKPFLLGAFGQGGSTALSWSDYTIIISKHYENKKSVVSFTIVRITEGDLNYDKNKWYEYCVDKNTGNPIEIEVNDKDFQHGTLVRHVSMKFGDNYQGFEHSSRSLNYVTHHYLFDPVIPFTIRGEREIDNKSGKNGYTRTVYGNNRKLINGGPREEMSEYKNHIKAQFKKGEINIYYWVLANREGKDMNTSMSFYCKESQPVIVTYNGQKHETMSATFIRNKLNLPYLVPGLIIQVDCDNIDKETKRKLFSTTRENIRDTSAMEELQDLIMQELSYDKNLRKINNNRLGKFQGSGDSREETERVKGNILFFIKAFNPTNGKMKIDDIFPKKNNFFTFNGKEPIIINDPPTLFEITSPDRKTVYAGKDFVIHFKTDAHPKYFKDASNFIPHIKSAQYIQYADVVVEDGYGKAYFHVNNKAKYGQESSVVLELKTNKKKLLTQKIDMTIGEKIVVNRPKINSEKQLPEFNVKRINSSHPQYTTYGLTSRSATKVFNDEKNILIWVNTDNINLTELVRKNTKKGNDITESLTSQYVEKLASYAYGMEVFGINLSEKNREIKEIDVINNQILDNVISPITVKILMNPIKTSIMEHREIE